MGTSRTKQSEFPAGNTPCTEICAHAVCDNFVTSARTEQILESADVRETRVNTGEKIGGPGRDRTDDLFHAMEARSQLRHRPTLEEGTTSFIFDE